MPFAKEHRARQASPDQFERFRRVHPADLPVGVEVVLGFKADGASEVQSIAFDSDVFTADASKTWLAENKFSDVGFEESKADRTEKSAIRFDDLGTDGATTRMCRRFDVMPLAKPELTPEGFVRAQGMITRAGIFSYRRQDGSIIKELRPPEQVFRADSLRSFSGMPLTLDHPAENLTPKTATQHSVGTVSSPVRINDHVRADLLILREDAIKAVMNDRKNKLSCGYVCTVVDQGGIFTHADGTEERFDAVQMDIIGNHVAICDNPRAGPSAQIRVDDAFADLTTKGDSTMEVEITINGKTYRVSKAVADQMKADGVLETKKEDTKKTDAVDDATVKALKEAQAERDAARGELAAVKAKADAEEKKRAEEAKKTDAKTSTKSRIELCAIASGVLDKKLDDLLEMEDLDIMRAVIAKQAPEMKLDGEGEAFVRGAFKTIVATKVDTAAELQKLVNESKSKKTDTEGDKSWESKADKAREASIQQMQDAWKPQGLRDAEKEMRDRSR